MVAEAVHQISSLGERSGRTSRFARTKRNADPAEASAVTVLCRQLIGGVLVCDLMVSRLCELAGQSREQVLDQLSGELPGQLPAHRLRALHDEPAIGSW
jgi:hypothetical protein